MPLKTASLVRKAKGGFRTEPHFSASLSPLRDTERRDLTKLIEDRAERASPLIASQLPVTDWHAVI